MAKATTYTVGSTGGNREDLTDIIKMVEITKYPVTSMIPVGDKPAATYHEWQVDEIGDVDTTAVLEGTDQANFDNQAENRARLGNYVMQLREPWSVSREQEVVSTAGVPSEVARSKARVAEKMKRKIEVQVCSDDDREAGDGSTARVSRALGDWIDSSGPSDVGSAYRTPSASIDTTATGSLTEALFNDVLQSVYESGGAGSLSLGAGPELTAAIANFTRITGTGSYNTYHVTQSGESHRMDLKVDLYQGPFNIVKIFPTVWNGRASNTAATAQSKARGYVLDFDLLSLNYLIKPGSEEFEDQGGGRRGMISAHYTLTCKNPKGLGKFAATS